jgi:hypothetical protein
MSRRLGRSRRWGSQRVSAAPPSLFEQVLALSAGRPVFTADKYALDGVSGRVRSWIDWNNPAHVLDQATSAAQVPVPAPHADFGGAVCAAHAGLPPYEGNLPGAADFMHDGTGGACVMVFTPTGATDAVLVATRENGRGFMIVRFSGPVLRSYVTTATDALVINASTPGGTTPIDAPTYIDFSFALSAAPDSTTRVKGAALVTQDAALAPEAGASARRILLGGFPGGFFTNMRWTALLFFPPLTPAQRTIVQDWIEAAYGLAAA